MPFGIYLQVFRGYKDIVVDVRISTINSYQIIPDSVWLCIRNIKFKLTPLLQNVIYLPFNITQLQIWILESTRVLEIFRWSLVYKNVHVSGIFLQTLRIVFQPFERFIN